MGLFDLGFGGMDNPLGSMGGSMQPIVSRNPGQIGGPNTGGKSQSQGAPGQFQQPQPIPNAAGYPGLRGTQSGVQGGLDAVMGGDRVVKDRLGFSQDLREVPGGPRVMPIPAREGARGGRFQPIGQGGSSVGEGMTQPLGMDLQQSQQGKGKLSFMDTLAQIESSGGTNTRNLISPSHVGKYQMSKAAFDRFSNGGDINNEGAQQAAAQSMNDYNRQQLGVLLGRNASDAETYLAYNQGLHGAWQLLSNPDKPAGSLVKPQHIQSNGGNPRAPARQFINTITQKWNETASGVEGQ